MLEGEINPRAEMPPGVDFVVEGEFAAEGVREDRAGGTIVT